MFSHYVAMFSHYVAIPAAVLEGDGLRRRGVESESVGWKCNTVNTTHTGSGTKCNMQNTVTAVTIV